ncbi:MAG: hypothetical protein R3C52_05435 [Hyphomonadaceae bacterium]
MRSVLLGSLIVMTGACAVSPPVVTPLTASDVAAPAIAVSGMPGRNAPATASTPTSPESVGLLTSASAAEAAESCALPEGGVLRFFPETLFLRPGQSTSLKPFWSDHPGGYDPVPAGCMTDLQVSDASLASLSLAETSSEPSITIADTAPDGQTVVINAAVGSRTFSDAVRIRRGAISPIVGVWSQPSTMCVTTAAIRELRFTEDGQFSVTWEPFEAYKDYWGTWSYDHGSGHLSLKVEGGNYTPRDIRTTGTVTLDGDALALDEIFLGTPKGARQAGCRAPFVR